MFRNFTVASFLAAPRLQGTKVMSITDSAWESAFRIGKACGLMLFTIPVFSADVAEELKALREQNQKLEEQLQQQQQTIGQLQESLRRLEGAGPAPAESAESGRGLLTQPFSTGNVLLSGEAGLAFFEQPSRGAFPNSEFRVDEAKLFLDVKLWEDIYFFTELNITEREEPDKWLYIGELYVDFENVLSSWRENWLNLRIGRFDTPFGEEYLHRDAIDNPLISHSLSDIWGVDEGVEAYGRINKLNYVLAVQNGGDPWLHDYNDDKAVIGKLGYSPKEWLYLSASAMRTGQLDAEEDFFSALWFGNGYFRSIGAPGRTDSFSADLFEGDVRLNFSRGHLLGAGGYVYTSDKTPHRSRDIYYYYTEGLYDITSKLYSAARWSHILAPDGYYLVGGGRFGDNMFGGLSDELWRMSIGFGYRITDNVLLKAEYSFNGGSQLSGASRARENLIGAEIAVRF